MKFCQDHWNAMRQAVEDRGLSGLVAKDGAAAVAQVEEELLERWATRETFDPLMSMHWAIATNAMRAIEASGGSPLYLMTSGDEDPVDVEAIRTAQPDRADVDSFQGRTWPRCPLCYVNLAHEITCAHLGCELDKKRGYDWMIDRAAVDALERARALGLTPKAS